MNRDDPCCFFIFLDLIICRCVNGSMGRFVDDACSAAEFGDNRLLLLPDSELVAVAAAADDDVGIISFCV